ncbi:MAG: hypothetical protein AAF182_00530 [Pseudomonadota bacterium]
MSEEIDVKDKEEQDPQVSEVTEAESEAAASTAQAENAASETTELTDPKNTELADDVDDNDSGGAEGDEEKDELSKEQERLEEEYWSSFDASTEIVFRKKIQIFSDQPLPDFDRGPVKAYTAKGVGKFSGDLIAYVCEPELTPRIKSSNVYPNFVNATMAKLVDYGLIYWAPLKKQRLVYFYANNFGKRLLDPNGTQAIGLKQDFVLNSIVKPVFGVLLDFRNKDFVHGSIAPYNMFDGGNSGEGMKVILGDCLVMPSSYDQKIIYETIQRGMAQPLGRGVGTEADDLYSLGVCIAVLMRSNDPMEGLNDDEVIRRKIDQGSYAALTGKDRFKGSILELLRGLLNDDAAARWDLDDVDTWLGGNRINPKQGQKKRKAPRPYNFNGNRYFYMESLAKDLHHNPPELEKALETEELQQWLSRALEDEETIEMLDLAYMSSHKDGKSGDYMARLCSNISSALDPFAPMRFKEYSLRADMFGHFLARAMMKNEDLNDFAEMVNKGTVMNWVTNYGDQNLDKVTLMSRFDTCRNYLKQTKIGYGVERCLYTLMPYMHCLSPKLEDYMVRTPDELVMAFEKMLYKGSIKADLFLDRHSVAFLAVRDSRVIEGSLYDLDGEHRHKKILANLLCFAVVQKKAALGPLPNLAKAFAEMMPEVLEFFHDRDLRVKMEKAVEKYAKDGNLLKMADVAANLKTFDKDLQLFRSAMVDYNKMRNELVRIDRKIEKKGTFGRNLAGDIAAFVSSMVAGIIIIVITFMFLEGKVLFTF